MEGPEAKTQGSVINLATLLIVLIAVGLWGCLMIYSVRADCFAANQVCWIAFGICAFLFCQGLPFELFRAHAKKLYWTIFVLLCSVLLFGVEINGMRGWFRIGSLFYFQPSELAKGVLCLVLSADAVEIRPSRFPRMCGAFLLYAGAILLQPDMGCVLVLSAGFVCIAVLAEFDWKKWTPIFLFLGGCGAAFVFLKPYAMNRIRSFVNSEWYGLDSAAWHLTQLRYTLAQGGWFGSTEPSGGVWAQSYLPYPHSDCLYASMVESTGLIGGAIILAGYCTLLFVCVKIVLAKRPGTDPDVSPDPARTRERDSARIYVFSIGFLYVFQALLHISVNTLLLPITGITLPLLSYGGSSVVSTMLFLGIAVSAAKFLAASTPTCETASPDSIR